MGFKCGIVGLPNVGKSTLFNALTQSAAAESANYPFCTIEPNVGIVSVPDERLYKIAELTKSEKIIPTQIEFVDIAGLVKGASKGEGLGNQFLSHIREVDAIVHLLRCFEDENVTHVDGGVDPLRDAETIDIELGLADLDSIEKRLVSLEKKAKLNKDLLPELNLMQQVAEVIKQGKPARAIATDANRNELKKLQLLTTKPILYVCNVSENELAGNKYTKIVENKAQQENAQCIVISAKIESEIALLDNEEDKKAFLASIGLDEPGLSKLIKSGYKLLDLITYFTSGPKETRAWTIAKGTLAPQAAGVIHTDFEKGFIRSETINYDDFMKYKGEYGAKEAGKLRLEGKEYLVCDGDIMHFRFNV